MSIAHLLEDFGGSLTGATVSISDVTLEDQRLESYEAGYKAGWDDAVKAQSDDSRRISSDFANNLGDISFTIEDAMQGLLGDLRPLIEEMVQKVLPRMAHQTLGQRVVEILETAARDGARPPIEVTTAPGNLTALETLIEGAEGISVNLHAEPTFGDGQVHVSLGTSEREIDLDALVADIQTAVATFFDAPRDTPQKETA